MDTVSDPPLIVHDDYGQAETFHSRTHSGTSTVHPALPATALPAGVTQTDPTLSQIKTQTQDQEQDQEQAQHRDHAASETHGIAAAPAMNYGQAIPGAFIVPVEPHSPGFTVESNIGSSGKKGQLSARSKSRACNYSKNEDLAVAKAWLYTSKNWAHIERNLPDGEQNLNRYTFCEALKKRFVQIVHAENDASSSVTSAVAPQDDYGGSGAELRSTIPFPDRSPSGLGQRFSRYVAPQVAKYLHIEDLNPRLEAESVDDYGRRCEHAFQAKFKKAFNFGNCLALLRHEPIFLDLVNIPDYRKLDPLPNCVPLFRTRESLVKAASVNTTLGTDNGSGTGYVLPAPTPPVLPPSLSVSQFDNPCEKKRKSPAMNVDPVSVPTKRSHFQERSVNAVGTAGAATSGVSAAICGAGGGDDTDTEASARSAHTPNVHNTTEVGDHDISGQLQELIDSTNQLTSVMRQGLFSLALLSSGHPQGRPVLAHIFHNEVSQLQQSGFLPSNFLESFVNESDHGNLPTRNE